MVIFKHYSLFIFSVALCSVLLCLAAANNDVSNPERKGYEQCVSRCQKRQPGRAEECREICSGEGQGGRAKEEECERRCSWESRGQREQQQCEESCRSGRQEQDEDQRDPRRRFQECSQRCQSEQRGQQQQDCRRKCQKEYERESEEHRRGRSGDGNSQDPRQRYQECQSECQQKEQDWQQQQQCQRRCQVQYDRERQERQEGRRGRGGEGDEEDPRQRFEECREECEKQERGGSKQECERRCEREYDERQRREEGQGRGRGGRVEEQEDNPYLFHSGHFQESFRSSDGSLRFLPKFISKSRLLRGLNHFRFAHLQAGPNTLYLPHHSDSDSVCAVTRGKGTITFVNHEKKESFNIEQGNVVRVPAGNTVYIANRESNETLNVAIFVNPVNNPGEFEDFYPAGVESPRSYFRAFSTEILEQALNTPREDIEKLFQGREAQQGIIRRASEEQLRAIIRHASSRTSKRDVRSPIDLTNQKPTYSNQNGRFFEALPNEFRQLEDIDISVGILDLKQHAMFAPHFNTRTTYVVHVAEGEAQVEMASPHLSRSAGYDQERRSRREEEEYGEERSGEIQSVRFGVSAGDVFIIPAGHPITMVATGNQNLRTVGFGVNARNNERVFLAGRENLLREMDSEVTEVAFGVPAKLVDKIFNNPKESYFLSRRGQQHDAKPLSSIVDELARLF